MTCSWTVSYLTCLIAGCADSIALGIHDEVDALEMKGNKKKKSRKLDEDFVVRLSRPTWTGSR